MECDSCNSTFWGETWKEKCDVNCINLSNETCLQKDGSCIICLYGYYGLNCKEE